LSAVHARTAQHTTATTIYSCSLPHRCNNDDIGISNPIAVEGGQLLDAVRLEHRLVAIHQFMADVRMLVGTKDVHFSLGNAFCLPGAIN
jgi:hypothetical protein